MLVKDIRAKLQNTLKRQHFVVEITTDTIEIEEPKNFGKKGALEKVIINNFPYNDYQRNWRINLEKEILGLSSSENKTEVALALLQKNYLNVYLIELKSRIDDKQLEKIITKFRDSISRFYFLLSLNDSNDHKPFPELNIRFKSIIFYNGNEKLDANYPYKNGNDRIRQIFKDKNKKQTGIMECETVLGPYKIPVQFFSKGFDKGSGYLNINFNDIKYI
jgi:hypothetical protein